MIDTCHRSRLKSAIAFGLALVAMALPATAGAFTPTVSQATGDAGDGTMSSAARQAQHGALTLAADDRAKARATAAADPAGGDLADGFAALAPASSRSWDG